MSRAFRSIWLAALAVALSPAPRAPAQPVRGRFLLGVSVERLGSDYGLRISFAVPIVYLRHAPLARGESLDIQLARLQDVIDDESASRRESLRVPESLPIPVDLVAVDLGAASGPVVEVRFRRPLEYTVEQGKDLRSLIVRVPARDLQQAAPPRAAPATRRPAQLTVPEMPTPPPSDAPATPREELMQEGRRALTAGDYERASALFTKLLSLPEGPDTPDALELLALSRERKGQRAHAKAEYGQYLERYPESEGAARVRQRLESLITAREEPTERPLASARRPERRPLDFETFGSLYAAYRYDGRRLEDAEGDDILGNAIFTDVHLENRLELEGWSLRNQVSGGYRYSFLEGGAGESRVSALFLEGRLHDLGLVGSAGRRSRSTGGVLGRYDGLEVSVEVAEVWTVGAIGGRPVDSSRTGWEGFDRYFGGLQLARSRLFGVLDVEAFAIGQGAGSYLDRAAVGAELRYFEPGRSLAVFLDYDVYYESLNTIQIVATWQPFASTYLTLFGDYRNVPTLTTRNALQGQGVGELEDLDDRFSRSEIEALAEDRTARASNLALSVSQRLAERYQLAFDVGASHLSGMPASGGVPGFPGTGFEFYYSTQFIANDVIEPGDLGVVGLRFVDGDVADVISGSLSARYPLTQRLRLTPRLRTDYRFETIREDMLVVSPALRLELDVWKLRFDLESGLDWDLPRGGAASELSYFGSFGIRHDF